MQWRTYPHLLVVQSSNTAPSSLNMLSEFDAIPGMVVPTLSFWSRLRHKFKLFGSQSTKPDGLLAPFRQIVLELYEELNTAVAR